MNIQWNAALLLTQHYEAPIRFYLHGQSIDLMNINTQFHNRIHGIDSEGKHHLLHQKDILFVCPVNKISDVKPYIKDFKSVKTLKLKQKTDSPIQSRIDDEKLQSIVGTNTALVTRRGQVIQGELAAFDNDYLFMSIQKEIILVYRRGLIGFREDVVANLKQNNPLDELRKKREKWVEANRENGFEDGIKNLLTDLYPDNAHFIYELLQNAEDAGASNVRFILNEDKVTFEHNGNRLFSLTDVEAITSIGYSTKKDDHTSIGKFGIGFKAVFAYTATPEIESGEFHFRIRDMVVPDTSNLFPASLGEGKTRFIFPFDNPKKPSENAQAEIKRNLQELNENALLFLSNIRRIDYCLPDSTKGYLELRKNENDDHRIEISIVRPGEPVHDSSHFLRFEKVVSVKDEENDEIKECKIAVAFGVDKPKNQNWKIKPLIGQVNIYFPAAKETSKLLLHMHAPFASTVARDSVRDCPANNKLLDHLAVLIAESMHAIRDRELLDVEFLATLPNDRDYLSPLYFPIQKQLIEEFNQKKLVPMKQGGHAAASVACRTAKGERGLSDLIKDKDLGTLLGKDRSLRQWIANPRQLDSSREDNFLTMLDISEWKIEDLIEILETESEQVMEWLKQKTDEWHQQLYALLEDSTSNYVPQLSALRIVRCIDGEYRIGSECHFFSDDVKLYENLFTGSTVADDADETESQKEEIQEEDFNYVDPAVYSFGNNKNQQEKARMFLETIKVAEVNETEWVKVILKQRYSSGSIRPHEGDMERFIALVDDETNTELQSIFKDYYIFETDMQRSNRRIFSKPSGVFLDVPYLDTGLTAYYDVVGEDSNSFKRSISQNYAKPGSNIDLENLSEFAEAVGAQTKFKVSDDQKIPADHPERTHLYSEQGFKETKTCINEDYSIPEIQVLLENLLDNQVPPDNPSIAMSKLIWKTMCSLSQNYLKARYRSSQMYELKEGNSSLVHQLRNAKWVPQKDDGTIFFVHPCDASIDRLPVCFPYEPGQEWLKAIEFAKNTKEQQEELSQRNQQAIDFGYDSSDEAEEVAAIIKDWKAQGKTPEQLRKKITPQKRREVKLIEELRDAPEKQYEQRARNVNISRGTIEPRPYLTANYTDDNKMLCQMCKKEMPFKKRNSHEDYFEAVEALRKDHFPIEHRAQYLAFCPNCAARYKEFIKRDLKAREAIHKCLLNSDVPEVSLQTNSETIHIWFAEKHWHDLKVVLYFYENVYNPEDSTD